MISSSLKFDFPTLQSVRIRQMTNRRCCSKPLGKSFCQSFGKLRYVHRSTLSIPPEPMIFFEMTVIRKLPWLSFNVRSLVCALPIRFFALFSSDYQHWSLQQTGYHGGISGLRSTLESIRVVSLLKSQPVGERVLRSCLATCCEALGRPFPQILPIKPVAPHPLGP
jgi:hypothetical protein